MKIITSPLEMKEIARELSLQRQTIGFVPTMGALHLGHQSLLIRASQENDISIASIYVNPTQFGPNEDLARYPRTLDADIKACESLGIDYVFTPENLYGASEKTWVIVDDLFTVLEGAVRPLHFKGVLTVVTKLFNLIRPTRAYFGRKDAQQLILIQRMVKELNMDVSVVPCEIVREEGGLAMSSRNRFLSKEERQSALAIHRALSHCRAQVDKGIIDSQTLIAEMTNILNQEPLIHIDYVAVVDAFNLTPLKRLSDAAIVAIAVKIGSVRLIDNVHF